MNIQTEPIRLNNANTLTRRKLRQRARDDHSQDQSDPLKGKNRWQMTYELVQRDAVILSAMNRRVGGNTRWHLGQAGPAVWWKRRFRAAKLSLLPKTPLKPRRASIWDTEFEVAARCRLAAFHLCSRRAPISTSVTRPRSITKNGGTRREGHARRRASEFNFWQSELRAIPSLQRTELTYGFKGRCCMSVEENVVLMLRWFKEVSFPPPELPGSCEETL